MACAPAERHLHPHCGAVAEGLDPTEVGTQMVAESLLPCEEAGVLVWNHAAPPPRCASRDAVVRLARLPEATAHWHAERVATPIRRRSFIHHCYHCRGGAEAVLRRRGRRCGVSVEGGAPGRAQLCHPRHCITSGLRQCYPNPMACHGSPATLVSPFYGR